MKPGTNPRLRLTKHGVNLNLSNSKKAGVAVIRMEAGTLVPTVMLGVNSKNLQKMFGLRNTKKQRTPQLKKPGEVSLKNNLTQMMVVGEVLRKEVLLRKFQQQTVGPQMLNKFKLVCGKHFH